MPFTTTGVLLTVEFPKEPYWEVRAAGNAHPKMQRDPRAKYQGLTDWYSNPSQAPGSLTHLFGNWEILPTTAEGTER